MKQSRIEREKAVVCRMIELYCKHRLKLNDIPEEYRQLTEYACKRLNHCKFGNNKTACKKCSVHCYAPSKREQIRNVMRWTGSRMLIYSPIEAIRLLLNK